MIDRVQQIKAEIERRMRVMKKNFATDEASKAKHAYTLRMIDHQELLSFINSLPEEPVSEDLEAAAEEYTTKVLERTNCLIGNQPVGE